MKKRVLTFAALASFALSMGQQINKEFMSSDSDVGNLNQYFGKKTTADSKPSAEKTSKFNPSVNVGVGAVLTSVLQQAETGSQYNFQPAAFKIGFLHVDLNITDKLMVGSSINLHTPAAQKITDIFVKYQPSPYFGIQAGRFKGAGNRGASETGAYDVDLGDFTYLSETQNADKGATDLRFYGIDLFGQYKWIKYSVYLHNNERERSRYYANKRYTADAPKPNNFFKLNSWDASLSLTPIKNVEFGGSMGSMSIAGMGSDSKTLSSAFIYYVNPNNLFVKAEWGQHYRIHFLPGVTPPNDDHERLDYLAKKKWGANVTAGFNISPKFEIAARYEHFSEGKTDAIDAQFGANKGYESQDLYTAGVTYYPFPESKRQKLILHGQIRDENGGEGKKLRNNWVGLTYQAVIFGRIGGNK